MGENKRLLIILQKQDQMSKNKRTLWDNSRPGRMSMDPLKRNISKVKARLFMKNRTRIQFLILNKSCLISPTRTHSPKGQTNKVKVRLLMKDKSRILFFMLNQNSPIHRRRTNLKGHTSKACALMRMCLRSMMLKMEPECQNRRE